MKKALTLLAIIIISTMCYSQNFWERIPSPYNLNVRCIAVNENRELFVGATDRKQNNGLFRSSDMGQTWDKVLNTENFQTYMVSINDSGHIFVGTGGFYPLRVSYDNGSSWDSIPVNSSHGGYSDIEFLGQDTILVATCHGNGAILLCTSNLGLSWDTLFMTENHTTEYLADIAIAPNGDISIGLSGHLPNTGGLYRSTDGGANWEFLGFSDGWVEHLEYNSLGDLFIGTGGSVEYKSIYAIYHDNPYQIVTCLDEGYYIYGLALNSAGHIYASSGFGVHVSKDNGLTFNLENEGLVLDWPLGKLESDSEDYIYALSSYYTSHHIYKTVNPTVTSVKDISSSDSVDLLSIFPNPVRGKVTGTFKKQIIDGLYNFTISELSGRNINCGTINLCNNTFSIDVSHLLPGAYILTIYTNELPYSAKIIKR